MSAKREQSTPIGELKYSNQNSLKDTRIKMNLIKAREHNNRNDDNNKDEDTSPHVNKDSIDYFFFVICELPLPSLQL